MHNQKTDVFISRRELESRKLDRAAILTLLIASTLIVGMQVRHGISVPEEPGMMDFSYLESAVKSRQHSWLQYSMHQQFTLLLWLPVTKLLHFLGLGAFWHYTTILYFRTSAILVALWLTNRRVANNCTSIVMALVCFTATPIRTASLYTHWWSHVIFFLGAILFLTSTKNRTIKKEIVGALCLSVFTSPMWTNLPHLVTGWLVIPYAILLFGRAFEKLQTLARRIGILTGVSMIVYLIPAIIYANGIDTLREIADTNVQIFSNYGPWLTLQGFGGWWYFDKICIGSRCDYLDPLNPIFTKHVFQVIRGSLIVGCILVSWRRFSQPYIKRDVRNVIANDRVRFTLPLILSFALAAMGHFDIYFHLRDRLGILLEIFREPYPKFSPAFYVMFSMWVAASFSRKINKFDVLVKTAAFAMSCVLIAPVFLQPTSRLPLLTRDDWHEIESSGKLIEWLPENSCVIDVSQNRGVSSFFQVRYAEHLSDLRHLRVTWINEAFQQLGRSVDGGDTCLVRSDQPFAVLVPVNGKSPNKLGNVFFGDQYSLGGAKNCEYQRSAYVVLYQRHCIISLDFTSSDRQMNNLLIDFGSDRIDLDPFLYLHKSSPHTLFFESFDPTITSATVDLACTSGAGREDRRQVKIDSGSLLELHNESAGNTVCRFDGIQLLKS